MREDAFVSKAPSRTLPKTDWICAGFYETHNAPRIVDGSKRELVLSLSWGRTADRSSRQPYPNWFSRRCEGRFGRKNVPAPPYSFAFSR